MGNVKKLGASLLIAFLMLFGVSSSALAAIPYPASDVLGQLTAGLPDFTTSDYNDISAPNNTGVSSANDVVVDTVNHRLFISDGGNNRIVVHNLDGSNNLIDYVADNVLGQSSFTTNASAASQSGLDDPHALAVDTSRSLLFVADQDNNRVVVYDYSTITNGENAVNVLGKADFSSNTGTRTQSGMNTPASLAFDSTNNYLYVGETANQRIMVFDTSSISDGENAVNVLGAPDFTTGGGILSAADIGNVEGLAIDTTGRRLFAADNTFSRVLIYDVTSLTNGENAVNVLGAPDFTTGGETTTSQSSTKNPGDISYDANTNYLYSVSISDRRVVVFNVASIANNENAVKVIGQPDFTTSSYYDSILGNIYPGGIDVANNKLYTVNIGVNSRVEIFDVSSIDNGENLVDVIGQTDGNGNSNFYSYIQNDQHPNKLGFVSPAQMVVDEVKHRLYIADTYNYRIVVHYLSSSNELIDYEADAVLGQTDFTSNIYDSSVQNRINDPTGLALDTKTQYLYVAENANSRVTVFDVNTITNGENAIFVLGAPDFTTYNNDLTAAGLKYPTHVEVDSDRKLLFVSDYLENRVLVYDTSSLSNGMNASYVLGQPDFVTNNDGVTTQASLDRPVASSYDPVSKLLFVSDETNARVMVFDTTSMSNGMNASFVLGQPNFVTNSFGAATASTIGTPGYSDIDANARIYYVWDYERILAFDITAVTNNENAVGVIGQPDFVTENYLAPTQNEFEGGVGLFFSKSNAKLYLSDLYYNRTLLFDMVRITTTSLPSGQQNKSYTNTLTYEDNQGTVSFSLKSGSLPAGLSLSPAGTISGTPTAKGTFPITVRITDNNGSTGTFTTVSNLTLTITGPDADTDGVEDSIEDSAPNGGDANGDGLQDSTQNKVSSNVNTITSGYTAIQTASGAIANYSILDEANLPTQNDTADFPVGLNSFSIEGITPGSSTSVTVFYDREYDTSSWTFMKYNNNDNTYTNMDSVVTYYTASVGGSNVTTATYTLTDGGEFDEDGIANGTIVDPAGPAVLGELADTGFSASTYVLVGLFLIISTVGISKFTLDK